MRYLLLTISFYSGSLLRAQTGKEIIAELRSVNQSVTGKPCSTGTTAAISNRAMNIFLADKTGYLSTSTDLSFYTNYASFNTSEGKFTVNHSFQKAPGIDEPVKKLFSAGFEMTVAGNYARSFLDKRFEQELGISVHHTWLGKTKTRFANCSPAQNISSQKQAMDALRIAMVEGLAIEINKKEADFESVLKALDTTTASCRRDSTGKAIIRQRFYEDLKAEYEEKFARLQAALLTKTADFKLIRTNWTSLTAYLPVWFPKYTLAPSLATPFTNKHPYPLNLALSHTRLWESSRAGRLFFTLAGNVLLNNSKLSYGLTKLNYGEYRSLGGTDTLHNTDPGNNKLYIGRYKTFVTPALALRIVYFPANSHVGISLLAEQNFGQYDFLNARLGIPAVLINRKKTPAVNIECYILFIDIRGSAGIADKTSIGLSIGMPFSRLIY